MRKVHEEKKTSDISHIREFKNLNEVLERQRRIEAE
jgi:hypothetical protein